LLQPVSALSLKQAVKNIFSTKFPKVLLALLLAGTSGLWAVDNPPRPLTWIVTNAPGTYHCPSEFTKDIDLTPLVSSSIPNSSAFNNVSVRLMARTHERMIMCASASAKYGGRIMADYEFRSSELLPAGDDADVASIKKIWSASKPLFSSTYYRGRVYYFGTRVASDEWITVFASADKRRIVVVHDNGPIHFSESSGFSWNDITNAGDYEFTLTTTPKGSALVAVVAISNQVHTIVADLGGTPKSTEWYSAVSTASGEQLILNGGANQTVPVLSISSSSNSIGISWPASFSGYILQKCSDLVAPKWANLTNQADVIDAQNVVTLPVVEGRNFFRLATP